MSQRKLKIIHIEDEPEALKLLEGIVKKFLPEAEYYASAATLVDGRTIIETNDFDLLFLDLQLSDGYGMSLVKEYPEIVNKTILCTADDSKGIEAIKSGVFYYILKPININEIIEIVKKYSDSYLKSPQEDDGINLLDTKLIIRDTNGAEIIPVHTIVRLESEINYTHIHLKSGEKILVSKTLKVFEDTLPKFSFIRIHRSHLINVDFIKRVNKNGGGSVELINGDLFKLSDKGRVELKEKLNI